VIGLGLFYVKSANLTPFVPPARPTEGASGGEEPLLQALLGVVPQQFGFFGIVAAASIVFFAYIGFDVVATTAEETRNPQRDMPRGILASLAICAALYMAVAFVITGMAKYTSLDTGAPLAKAFTDVGVEWASKVISLGAICGITTVILVLLLGQARVLFAMSRDHLLPPRLAQVHPRYGTPWLITVGTGVGVALVSGFVPLAKLSELTSIGTLFAFVVVAIGVVVLRRTRPDLPRAFRAPLVPVLPILSVVACLWLMINLPVDTWIRFLIWMAIGVVLYFAYGMRAAGRRRATEAVAPTPVSPAGPRPHDHA
jgi:APA family basic amino acid/polyamine antiporter